MDPVIVGTEAAAAVMARVTLDAVVAAADTVVDAREAAACVTVDVWAVAWEEVAAARSSATP